MTPRQVILLATIVFTAVCVSVFLLYTHGGGFSHGFSTKGSEWGHFGSYFGGVAGTVLTLFTVVLLVVSTMQADFNTQRLVRTQIRQQSLRFIDAAYEDIKHLLHRRMATLDDVEFGDYVFGEDRTHVLVNGVLVRRLLHGTVAYVEAIRLFVDNHGGDFTTRMHVERAGRYLDLIDANSNGLEEHERMTAALVRAQLSTSDPAASSTNG